jgi:hypothetical protein
LLLAAIGMAAPASAATIPVAPYPECPAVGAAPTCDILLVVNNDGSVTVYKDDSVGPYDGSDDTIVGIWNQSSSTVNAVTVNGPPTGLGELDGDGICTYSLAGCPFGPTGYEGPDTAIKTSPSQPDSAEIDFTKGLAPNATAYFSLEGALTLADLTVRQGPLAVTGTFGGYWANPNIYFNYGGGHRYLGNVSQGAANWTNAGTKIHITQWPGVPYAVHISVSDVTTSDTFWAVTGFAANGSIPNCVACVYSQNTITFIRPTVDQLKDFMRTKVATHEFGHAISLRHPRDVGLTSTRSIMNQGILSYNTPQAYDIGLVKAVYP